VTVSSQDVACEALPVLGPSQAGDSRQDLLGEGVAVGLRAAVTVDAGTARVTVEFAARVPLVLAGGAGGIPITAEATATAPLSRPIRPDRC
jgi:hypothetical protein